LFFLIEQKTATKSFALEIVVG